MKFAVIGGDLRSALLCSMLAGDGHRVYSFALEKAELPPEVGEQVELAVKYEGYIRRQEKQIAEMERLENRLLPEDIDYAAIQGLRLEAREKLAKLRPRSLGQAGRVSGVSPADIAVLMVYLGK